MIPITDEQVRRLRLRSQWLVASPTGEGAASVVGHVVGLQAQEPAAALLGVRLRSGGSDVAAVQRALVDERTLVRTWVMRGTLHLVAAADVGWLVALLGPLMLAGRRRRHAELGIAGEIGGRGVQLMAAALARRGVLTRAELAAELTAHGIPTAGQAIAYLISRAALAGAICCGRSCWPTGRPSAPGGAVGDGVAWRSRSSPGPRCRRTW